MALAAAVQPALESPGEMLQAGDRTIMQRHFGRDFSAVRVHDGAAAARSAAQLRARAYTVGPHVVFGAGEYHPGSDRTLTLLAHELTHVSDGSPAASVMRLGSTDDPEERRARRAADAFDAGAPIGPMSAAGSHGDAIVVRRSHKDDSPPTAYENPAELVIGKGNKIAAALALLNGERLIGAPPNELAEMQAVARRVIRPPDIKSEVIGQTGPGGAKEDLFRATVREVRANDGGVELSILTPPPWTTVTTRDVVRKELQIAACAGPDACTLEAHGKPTGAALESGTRAHEERHAADNRKAFETTIAAWDDKLTEAQKNATEFSGSLKEVAAKLWGHMGGKPEEVANAYAKAVFDFGQAYHAAEPHPRRAAMNARAMTPDCSRAEVDIVPVK